MKKLILIACCLLMLTGCSDAYAKLSNPKEVIMSIDSTNITKEQIYKLLMAQDSAFEIINYSKQIILDKEVPLTDEMKADAQTSLDSFKAMLGDSFMSYLNSYGYRTETEYLDKGLLFSMRMSKLNEKYVGEKFDEMVTKYVPRKTKIMQFTDQEVAKAALAEVAAGADFEATAKKHKSTTTGAQEISTNQTEYAKNVANFLLNVTTPTLSEIIPNDDSTAFFIVQVVEADPNLMKEEVMTTLASIAQVGTDATQYFFDKYGFKLHDKQVYDQFKANYPEYIGQGK